MSPWTLAQAAALTLMTGAALLMLVLAVGSGANDGYVASRLKGDAALAEGVILGVREQRSSRSGTIRIATFKFVDKDGVHHTNEERLAGQPRLRLSPGTVVAVRYDPTDPRVSSIKSVRALDNQHTGAWIMLAVLLAAGAFALGQHAWQRRQSATA